MDFLLSRPSGGQGEGTGPLQVPGVEERYYDEHGRMVVLRMGLHGIRVAVKE